MLNLAIELLKYELGSVKNEILENYVRNIVNDENFSQDLDTFAGKPLLVDYFFDGRYEANAIDMATNEAVAFLANHVALTRQGNREIEEKDILSFHKTISEGYAEYLLENK